MCVRPEDGLKAETQTQMGEMKMNWFKFYVRGDAAKTGKQYAFSTRERAQRYCDGMHGHQSLTQWDFCECTAADVERIKAAGVTESQGQLR
jgi:hypothetical protein